MDRILIFRERELNTPSTFDLDREQSKKLGKYCLSSSNPEGHYTIFIWRKHYLLAKDIYLGKHPSGCRLDFKKMVFRFPE